MTISDMKKPASKVMKVENFRYWLSSEGDSQGSGTYNKIPEIVIVNDGNE